MNNLNIAGKGAIFSIYGGIPIILSATRIYCSREGADDVDWGILEDVLMTYLCTNHYW